MKNFFFIILKYLIMAFFLFLIVKQVHLYDYSIIENGKIVNKSGIISSIAHINKFILMCALFLTLFSYSLVGFRWKQLLEIINIPIQTKEAVKLTFIGNFVGQFIPGMVGGDILKAFLFSSKRSKKSRIYLSVIVDRFFGVFGFAMLALIMLSIILFSGILDSKDLYNPLLSVLIIISIILCIIIFLENKRLQNFILSNQLFKRLNISNHIINLFDSINLYKKNYFTFIRIAWTTLVAQLLGIGSVMLIGVGLNLEIAWYFYLLYVPLIVIISAVPLTPGGIGMMENLYIIYFSLANNESQVLVLAVLVRFIVVLANLIGGCFILFDNNISLSKIKKELKFK